MLGSPSPTATRSTRRAGVEPTATRATPITLTGIGLLIYFIAGAELFGISIVVGSFAAGSAVRLGFADNLALLNGLESLEDFFAAIFFVTLGSLVTAPTFETGVPGFGLFRGSSCFRLSTYFRQ